ncbi:MAG: helix-turn-helix domain-containing protein, partial [Acidobacteria bacterium]|nr:helix-turn-helix domain-containing protein [Acidobacteriota bacterium]
DLISQGFLAQTEGQYPTIVLTEKSEAVLRGTERVELIKVKINEDKKVSLLREVSHEYFKDLFDDLKKVRTAFAREENVPPYVVFSDATLVEFATYLPQTTDEIRRISGVGDLKLEKYGANFLKVIKDYCENDKLVSRINLKTPKREQKKRTKRDADGNDTYTVSLKMFKSGASIAKIAESRGMAESTIETHLVRFIQSGEISVREIVSNSKAEDIRNAILKLDTEATIERVKEFLGEDYSYGEIRAVIAEFLRYGNMAR